VDFIVELLESTGYDAVMTIVESVSKQVHFIPTNTTIIAKGATWLFLHHVWKLHGLPNSVMSNWGPQFIALFTRELYQLLGIKIAATTMWHPQLDGQIEQVNQELDQYLQVFMNCHDLFLMPSWLRSVPLGVSITTLTLL
jgi:hypothetical protein